MGLKFQWYCIEIVFLATKLFVHKAGLHAHVTISKRYF